MKVVELLKIGGEMLKLMSKHEVNRDDWRFVPMYEEFQVMRRNGVKYRECVKMLAKDYHVGRATVERAIKRLEGYKTTYIVATIAQKYGICERKVYKVVKHFRRECQIGAAG